MFGGCVLLSLRGGSTSSLSGVVERPGGEERSGSSSGFEGDSAREAGPVSGVLAIAALADFSGSLGALSMERSWWGSEGRRAV